MNLPNLTSSPRTEDYDKHICINAFLDLSGRFPPHCIAHNSTVRSFQDITIRFWAAMDFAVSTGNYPASQCPMCRIAHDLIELGKEVDCLGKNESLWHRILTNILAFLLDRLRSPHLRVESKIRELDGHLIKEIIEGQQRKISNAESAIAAVIGLHAYGPGFGSPSLNSPSGSNMLSNAHGSNISRNNINNVAGNLHLYSHSTKCHRWSLLLLLNFLLLLSILLHYAPRF